MLGMCVLLVGLGLCSQPGALAATVECGGCNEEEVSACHPPRGCELVRESGCGCCLTCALAEGAACGVYTGRCASGLRCVPRGGQPSPLQALLQGRGVCRSVKRRNQLQHTGRPLDANEKYSFGKRRQGGKNHENHGHHVKLKPHQGNRHSAVGTVHTMPTPSKSTPVTTLAPDSDYGPCRREMELILQDLQPESLRSPEDIYIPNCDKRGYYRSKQCKSSKGRRRGHCWCVDNYGHSLPGLPGRKRSVSCSQTASSEEFGY